MSNERVEKSPLPWWLAGLLLGGVQILAVAISKPLGVSTQFVVVDTLALKQSSPEYVAQHPVIGSEKYQKLGGGFWLDVGLVAGAFIATLVIGRWRLQATTAWWRANRNGKAAVGARLLTGFIGGFLILLGARLAHGCTSGQFASGWAQLSVAAIPFTITLFGFGMLAARIMYPKTPDIEA
ncbi:MAG: YeeE/YedE family protein [Sedimentisphaerales bacterium]|nr:YeeE/YedE family protein [Sedimentisphaerales bacterium]